MNAWERVEESDEAKLEEFKIAVRKSEMRDGRSLTRKENDKVNKGTRKEVAEQ